MSVKHHQGSPETKEEKNTPCLESGGPLTKIFVPPEKTNALVTAELTSVVGLIQAKPQK